MKVSVESLKEFFLKHDVEPQLEPDSGQLFVVFELAEKEVPIFFSIREEGALLQIIAYLPIDLTEETFSDIARMLHQLNREFDMPGFGMDEENKLLFYRAAVPCLDKTIDERLLNMYITTCQIACETFMSAFKKAMEGKMTVEEAKKKQHG